jgi:molybdate transport system ATP-binding protein
MPATLSGGERQRVAIGRALLAHPRLLLMDEPLAALDEARKDEILPYVERLRDGAGIPIVYVSHSVGEVARLATTVALVEGGRIKTCGPTAEVLARPDLTANGALLAPSTLLDAHVTARDDSFGLVTAETPAGPFQFVRETGRPGERLKLRILASDVLLSLDAPRNVSALNIAAGRIESISGGGAIVDVALSCGSARLHARITAKSCAALGLEPGMAVFAMIKTVSVATP